MKIMRVLCLALLFSYLLTSLPLSATHSLAKNSKEISVKTAKKNKKIKKDSSSKKNIKDIQNKKEINLPVSSDPLKGPSVYSEQVILIDFQTKEILYEKNPDFRMPPSSMTKIILSYLIFKELKAGHLKLTDTYPISEKAWRKGGSKMFVQLNSRVTIDDLLKGVIIVSGNDASIVLAEGLAGTEEVCAAQANELAKELGAKNTHFTNLTGWPDEQHYSTVRDLALMSIRLIQDFPEYYPLYKEKNFTYNSISQMNRNPLLGSFPGADGVKTGFTDAGGYGLVGSAIQDNRRLVMVINGAQSKKQRAVDSNALMQWGFNFFTNYLLAKANSPIGQADVWLGNKEQVSLGVSEDLITTIPRTEIKNIKAEFVYKGPLAAPFKKGQEIGTLVITAPGRPPKIVPLQVLESVEKANFFTKIVETLKYFFKGHKKPS